MRILAINAGDTATLVATPAMVATLPVSNLQTQYREQVARSVNCDSQLIEASWTAPTILSCVCLYRTNFSSTATWQVDIYTDATMSTLLYTSGSLYASRPKALGELLWGFDPLGATLYTGFGSTISTLWFTPVIATYMRIVVQDPANKDGYLQAARLFTGQYFEPSAVAPEAGATLAWNETTVNNRTEGGTLRSEPGTSYRVLSLKLGLMIAADRVRISDMLRITGMKGDGFISVFPNTGDALERDHQMQFKFTKLNPISITNYFRYESQLDLEEI
jgi:hypothetical protein